MSLQQYRPEIDGLRAVAVSLVILFHADVPGFSGGYIGVDIFFVISGFLITSIIARQIREDGFSYWTFMERRIRRILPALMVVMLSCIPFAWGLMLPDQLENFGQSLFATSLSANNILLWLTSGYWDLAAEFKPLLHTWSLGVEEQFYIIYPVLMLVAMKLSLRHTIAIFLVLAFFSFLLMVSALNTDPAGAFYLLHYRAWQLLIGGLGALFVLLSGTRLPTGLDLLGVVLILAVIVGNAFFRFSMTLTIFVATIGALLFLVSSRGSGPASRLLSSRMFVSVGLLSYSLYLWHQPAFALLRISRFDHTGPLYFVAVVPLVVLLAWATWNYIEKPFRNSVQVPRFFLFVCVGGGLVTITSVGLVLHVGNGFPIRMAGIDAQNFHGGTIAYNERVRSLPADLPEVSNDKPSLLVVGNSFARDFVNVLIEAGFKDKSVVLYREDMHLCPDRWNDEQAELTAAIDALVFASGRYDASCAYAVQEHFRDSNTGVWFVGTKSFGYNLNPLVNLSSESRARVHLRIPEPILKVNNRQLQDLGNAYIDLMSVLSPDDVTVRVADQDGFLLTTDRIHLSQAGAQYLAQRLPMASSSFASLIALAR